MARSPRVYGQGLADIFHLDQSPVYFAGAVKSDFIAATEIRCDMPNNGLSEPIPREPAYLMAVHLRDCAQHELWVDGRQLDTHPLQAGSITIYDLRTNPIFNHLSPFHAVYFYLPQPLLDSLADQEGRERIAEICGKSGLGLDDPTIRDLAGALMPTFSRPNEANLSFVDHVMTGMAAYFVRRFGKRPPGSGSRLTNAQIDRIEQLLESNLGFQPTTAQLAAEIGVQPRTLHRAFLRSKGVPPGRWLLRRRIEIARDMLLHSDMPVTDIAAKVGFSDAGHFTRTFIAANGLTPAEWRNGFF